MRVALSRLCSLSTVKHMLTPGRFYCVTMSIILAPFCYGVEYAAEPSLRVITSHSDNVRLAVSDETSLQGREFIPGLLLQASELDWRVSLDTDLTFNNYNRGEFDSDDQSVTLDAIKATERQRFSFRANSTRDSTRTSELDTTGIVTDAVRRELYSFAPQWSYQVSDRSEVTVLGSISEVSFKDDEFTDYSYDVLQVIWNSTINEAVKASVQLTGTQYEPDAQLVFSQLSRESTSDAVQLQVGGDYQITEKLSINALVGSAYTDRQFTFNDPEGICNLFPDFCDVEDFSDANLTTNVAMQWDGSRNDLSVEYSIQNTPSSQSVEIESERVKLDWTYYVSSKSNLKTEISYSTNESVGLSRQEQQINNVNREFGNVSLGYSYRVAKEWRVFARGTYRWQDREINPGQAEANEIRLGIDYKPTKFVWSR